MHGSNMPRPRERLAAKRSKSAIAVEDTLFDASQLLIPTARWVGILLALAAALLLWL